MNFGPVGLPENIPVTQKVKVTGVYIYFTLNDQRINNTTTFGPLFKLKADPLDPSRTDLFLPTDFVADKGFFVLRGVNGSDNGLTLFPADFDKFKIPKTVNGMHIVITVTPV